MRKTYSGITSCDEWNVERPSRVAIGRQMPHAAERSGQWLGTHRTTPTTPTFSPRDARRPPLRPAETSRIPRAERRGRGHRAPAPKAEHNPSSRNSVAVEGQQTIL